MENLNKPATTGKSKVLIKVCPPKRYQARQFSSILVSNVHERHNYSLIETFLKTEKKKAPKVYL